MILRQHTDQTRQLKKLLYGLLLAAAIFEIGLTYRLTAPDVSNGMSSSQSLFVKLSVLFPEIVIWLIAARGARRFKTYATSIKSSADGRSMNQLANGLLLVVVYIVLIGIAGSVLAVLSPHGANEIYIVAANYGPLIVILTASLYLYRASKMLVTLSGGHLWSRKSISLLLIPYSLLMGVFVYNFYLLAPTIVTENGVARFHLPIWFLMLTYIVPHMIVWLLGILSAVNLASYSKHVGGSIYKSLFRDVYRSVLLVFLAIFCSQMIITSPLVANTLNLGLVLIYALLILGISGFLLLYRGAKKLQKLEGV